MKIVLPAKRTLLAFSLTSVLAACGTTSDNAGDDSTNNSDGRDTSISSTAGGYETSSPIGSSGSNDGRGNSADNGRGSDRYDSGQDGSATGDSFSNGTGERPIAFTINFELDSSEMSQESVALIKEHASYMRANPSIVVVVEGHADERGSREYNIGLGQRRAEATRRLLSLEGVSKERIDTISFGEEKPLDFGHTESSWSTNRRAVFVYPI